MPSSTAMLFLAVLLLAGAPPPIQALPRLTLNIRPHPLTKFLLQSTSKIIPTVTPVGFFYVELAVGKPPQQVNLAFHTRSALTWLQCSDCQQCFPVSKPNFNSENSTIVLGKDPVCVPPIAQPSPSGNSCIYNLDYSIGRLVEDSVSLYSSSELVFGCGVHNFIGFPLAGPGPNPIGGMIGLGLGHPSSILSQMEANRFSYCLPAVDDNEAKIINSAKSNATLEIGGNATIGGFMKTTTILPNRNSSYYVNVTGISVNGTLLAVIPGSFLPTPAEEGGFTVDPSSALSHMSPQPYAQLKKAVMAFMSKEHPEWKEVKESQSGMDLCYSVQSSTANVTGPQVQLYFSSTSDRGGKPVALNLRNVFFGLPEFKEICMLIMPLEGIGPSILGGFQQIGTRFVFDVANSKLHFAEHQC